MPIEYPVCLFIRPPCNLHASVRTPSASKFTDPDTHRGIAYDALLQISVTRSDEPSFHPASLFPPLPSSPPSSKRSKMERRDRGTWDTILPRMYIFAELCNCATLVDWRLIVSRERERERNEDYDKWSAFIMQQSTITTGIMQMDRWKIKETRLLVSPFAFVMSKHAWSYDSNEYKSYCNGTRLRALSSPFYEGLTKKERRQAQNRLRLFEFKIEINRCEWVYCKREKKK